jgi:hypothetical protein
MAGKRLKWNQLTTDQIEVYWKDSNVLPDRLYVWKGSVHLLSKFGPDQARNYTYSSWNHQAVHQVQTEALRMEANAVVDLEVHYVTIGGEPFREVTGTAIWYDKD